MLEKSYFKPLLLSGLQPPEGENPLLPNEPGPGEVGGSGSGLGDQDTPAP